MEDPSRQAAPAQTPPATQGALQGRATIARPAAVIAAATATAVALPLAEHAFGWVPTVAVAVAVVLAAGLAWVATQAAVRALARAVARAAMQISRDGDRDRIRGEAALRRLLADAALREEVLIAETQQTARLTWRILQILRQQERAGRRGGAVLDRELHARLDRIERVAGALANFRLQHGQLTHRIEQVEGLVEEERGQIRRDWDLIRKELAEHFVDQLHGGSADVRRFRPRS